MYRWAVPLLFLLAALAGACSDRNASAPLTNRPHPEGWLLLHADDPDAQGGADDCKICHGLNFEGSGRVPSCFACHVEGPPFRLHPLRWGGDAVNEHQHFSNLDLISWTTCAVGICHGTDLRGGGSPQAGATGPSCFSTTFTNNLGVVFACHTQTGGPPKPAHQIPYDDPSLHGRAAKDYTNIGETMLYCRNCHGRPPNVFDGGFVADPAILNNPNGNCSQAGCHPAAEAHPTNWQGTNDDVTTNNHFSTHRSVSQLTVSQACALCHNTAAAGAGPKIGAPSCFSATFTNADGSPTSCHPTGPGAAPHAVPFTDPNLHGPAAKADLTFCQQCHAASGGPGSNPRFNVSIGNLTNGCEECHVPKAAHPPSTILPTADRWTFRGDITTTRRTHFAAGNVLNACALCHGVNLDGVGGVGPSCFTCHVSAPQFALNCTFCHGIPPAGAADLTGGTPVDHTGVTDLAGFRSAHNECTRCHGASDDGTGKLAAGGADYLLFDKLAPALSQGGDHLDGQIEMNGPFPATGAGYNPGTFGCDNACHSGSAPFRLPNSSGLQIEFGNYGNEVADCTFCHGYPPTESTSDVNPVVVDHDKSRNDGGTFLLSVHNECVTCHGVKDDGTGTHSPVANYDVARDHFDGNIHMNQAVGYNQANFGCDAACHANDAAHQLADSTLPVVLADYGSGGGTGACANCHDTGVGGAPIVKTNITPHAGTFPCEGCHTGHNTGLSDPNVPVVIPNNSTVGINYGANGEAGISLGGADAPGSTEAQICWSCHDTFGISEWGQNTEPVTGNSPYDYGQIFTDATLANRTSNWIGAVWNSGRPEFAYKKGQIQSTHAADPGAVRPGVDAVADIRCSYCHDVHDLNRAPNDTVSGKPYLRGTWRGNPYREDGAPRSTNPAPPNLNDFGQVPRGGVVHNEYGGFQIDQNNGNPTAGWTLANSAGLCTLCHGSNVDAMNEFDVDEAGSPQTPVQSWVGTNGHANAAIGGTGLASGLAANIYRESLRRSVAVPPVTTGQGQNAGNPMMAYLHVADGTSGRGYGFRSKINDENRGWDLFPNTTNFEGRPYTWNLYDWGATVRNDNTVDNQYHKFSCSKCHNPHASRLPRLMITNCLDTNHNTWDDPRAGIDQLPPAGTQNKDNTDGVSVDNGGVTWSNTTSAQNCHRLKDPQFPNSRGSGWNNVTPWVEF